MKYLIVGLGNIGHDYQDTRHNIGFSVLDALARASNIVFEDKRYGFVANMRVKNKTLVLLKPSTYMNLSGLAVRYWLKQEKIEDENLLVIVDDIALPFGTLRLKPQGSDAGHNGLRSIQDILGHNNYARLRFGIGNDFPQGYQSEYVLGKWDEEEAKTLPDRIKIAGDIIKTYCLSGAQFAMNMYNNK